MIVINTLGRPNTQPTLTQLKEARLNPVLLVQAHEKDMYDRYDVEVMVLPEYITRLPETRQWLMENSPHDKVIIIDDDFTFFTRIEGTVSLRRSGPEDVREMIDSVYTDLDVYPVVGISMRQGNNRVEDDYKENSAINGFIGARTDIITQEGVRFDGNPLMDDKHLTLGLLTRGFKNKVHFKWCYNQPASNTSGGASVYRTPELQREAAELLHKNYPDFVSVKIKTTKGGWFGGERHDVVCYWKKAYQHGLSKKTVEFEQGTNLL